MKPQKTITTIFRITSLRLFARNFTRGPRIPFSRLFHFGAPIKMRNERLLLTITMSDLREVNILIVSPSKSGIVGLINSMGDGHPLVIDATYGPVSDWEYGLIVENLFTVTCKKPIFKEVVNLFLTVKH